jgi:hypothetical protein
MRRFVLAILAAAMLVAAAAPAGAHPTHALAPTLPTDLTHAKTNNLEYLGRFPEHTGTAGGHLSADGKTFFVTDPRGVFAYDVTNPASPTLLDSVTLYQTGEGAALAQEDPDTDGKIMLVDGTPTMPATANFLHVVDVSNPRDIKIRGSLSGVSDHTWECISGLDNTGVMTGCAYAYGRTGHIIDLRDPSAPKKLSTTWRSRVGLPASNSGASYTHDLNEIRPGLVMSAGATNVLMDTTNPASPVKLTSVVQTGRFSTGLGYHSVEWPNAGADRYLTFGTEITPPPFNASGAAGAGSDCEGSDAVIETWDATHVLAGLEAYQAGAPVSEAFAGRTFTKVDTFDAGGRGIFQTGNAPANVLYCAHWFEPNPQFNNGGIVAVAYYDRGTRFVNVDGNGKMTEIGWMVPAEGYAGSVQWVSNDVAYVMDYRRGLEILRLKPTPATGVVHEEPAAIAVGSHYVPPSALHVEQLTNVALGLFGLVVVGGRVRQRRQRRAAEKA